MSARTLGYARIVQLDDGSLAMDQDSLRRADFSGQGTGYDDGVVEFGYDYDDYGDDDDDDEDDETESDEDDDEEGDFEGDEDDEFGDAAARRSRRAKRKRSSAGRKMKRANRKLSRAEELESKNRSSGKKRRSEGDMQGTLITEASTETTAGSVSITIRPNHDFDADNIVFDGSASTARVNSVIFGDQLIFSNATGTPVTVFAANNPLRSLLKGSRARVRSGQTIVINGSIANDGDALVATLTGKKPALRC